MVAGADQLVAVNRIGGVVISKYAVDATHPKASRLFRSLTLSAAAPMPGPGGSQDFAKAVDFRHPGKSFACSSGIADKRSRIAWTAWPLARPALHSL